MRTLKDIIIFVGVVILGTLVGITTSSASATALWCAVALPTAVWVGLIE